MPRYAYWNASIGLVSGFTDVETIDEAADPGAGEELLETTYAGPSPAYFDGTEVVAQPPQPYLYSVWDPATLTWLISRDLCLQGKQKDFPGYYRYHLELGIPFEVSGEGQSIPMHPQNQLRVMQAAEAARLSVDPDPFDMRVNVGLPAESFAYVVVTRSEALSMHEAMVAHLQAIDAEYTRFLAALEAAYALEDEADSCAAIDAVAWEYDAFAEPV